MLYIIYGLTLSVTKESRAIFDREGISQISKLTYETKDVRIKPSDGVLKRTDDEALVRSFDYVYENHGRVVGFSAEQIESAVNGRTDAYLTFSSEDLSFLREIKDAYGEHVAIIYAFIEDRTLAAITNALDAPEEQKRHRLAMGRSIKERFLAERELFDEVVLYTGEGTQLDFDSLKVQYDHIIKKYRQMEKELVPLPYKGTKPYIFVSYARDDSDRVIPYLRQLQKHGCRIWFDKGIKGGENWMTTLAMKIKGCTQYLLFSSANSAKSVWTGREASRALQFPEISILTVRMDDARFEEGLEWGLECYQQLFMDQEDFMSTLLDSISEDVIERIGDQ